MKRAALLFAGLVTATAAQAAEPVRIGLTTVLSGPTYDRGQSEQYGAQLALNKINESGGVLGRPVEIYYADNACKLDVGVPATKRLIEQEHVPVLIGALCTPVTHAIMPVIAEAKVPSGDRHLGGAGFCRCVRRRRQRLCVQDHPVRGRYRARPDALARVAERQVGRHRRRRRRLPPSQRGCDGQGRAGCRHSTSPLRKRSIKPPPISAPCWTS